MDAPKKYIRTYAGDMVTVQKGGTPDLAPLTDQPIPQPSVSAGNSASRVPTEAVMATYEKGLREASERAAQDIPPSAAAQAWEEDEQTRSQTLERLQERARTTGLLRKGPVPPPVVHENIVLPVFEPPPPATPPPPLPTPPPQASPRSALPEPSSPLHTYGSDFSDRVERTRASATSMLA